MATFILKIKNKPKSILLYPDQRLKEIAKEVDFDKMSNKFLTNIVRKLGHVIMNQNVGMQLGLAAPQIGIPLRIMIVRGNIMVNPTWTPSQAPLEEVNEICESIPGKLFRVARFKYGWAEWYTLNGERKRAKINGIPAIVFQHELDHLNGICCSDIGRDITKENNENGGESNSKEII